MQNRSYFRRSILLSVFALLVLLSFFALDARLKVQEYKISSAGFPSPVRIALLTDLHSCSYGKAQADLIDAIATHEPDLILIGGDFFDDVLDETNSELLLAGIANQFPCFYVCGNHEYWSGAEKFSRQMEILKKYGVTLLSGDCETIVVNGAIINICGMDDPDAYKLISNAPSPESQLQNLSDRIQNDSFNILLSHRPEYFDTYCDYGFNLVLCGHAHGGQWRIPGILNGLYAPNQGFFPEYAGGRYEAGDTTMIVSRGLARESTRVPRIFNRPELVIIDLC